jgi:predicted nucleotidyltransferase
MPFSWFYDPYQKRKKVFLDNTPNCGNATSKPYCCRLNIPKMGINMPKMGIREKAKAIRPPKHANLADALFSTIQQRVLAYLFGQPERSFFATELIKLAGGGSGAVQRELARLADSGLVTVTRVGTQKHYQANPKSPIFAELCAIAQKTVGLAEPLREALAPLAERITAAFVFGSVAKRSDTAASDIDVLVLSDSVDYADVFAALQPAEAKLGRTVNPTVYTPANWRKKRKDGNAFVVKVAALPKVFLIGTEENLA